MSRGLIEEQDRNTSEMGCARGRLSPRDSFIASKLLLWGYLVLLNGLTGPHGRFPKARVARKASFFGMWLQELFCG
jgi:hypothetical protein